MTEQRLTLEQLYRLYCEGKLSSNDPRWEQVQSELRGAAVTTVRQVTSSRGLLYGAPFDNRVEDVYTAILVKFLSKRFAVVESFGSLLMTSARNALIDAMRVSGSVNATDGFDTKESSWPDDDEKVIERDLYGVARRKLDQFRWREYPHVREALLSYFLTHMKLPGPAFLNSFSVPMPIRNSVYNAAAFDINSAMESVCEDRT